MLTLEVPYPPSVNHYYRRFRKRVVISDRGRSFREAVGLAVARLKIEPFLGPLEMRVDLYPPDRRRFDVDNPQKALLDSMQHAGVYADDSQIVHLDVWKREPVKGGKAVVRVRELT